MWQGEPGKKRNQVVIVGLGGWHWSKDLRGKGVSAVLFGEECRDHGEIMLGGTPRGPVELEGWGRRPRRRGGWNWDGRGWGR